MCLQKSIHIINASLMKLGKAKTPTSKPEVCQHPATPLVPPSIPPTQGHRGPESPGIGQFSWSLCSPHKGSRRACGPLRLPLPTAVPETTGLGAWVRRSPPLIAMAFIL